MIKICTGLIALLLAGALSRGYPQSVAPFILNAGGSSAVVNGNTFELSFGELVAISTATTPNLIVTQGVLQPFTTTTILPVTLVRFQGIKMRDYNKLDWVTGFESGTTQFELQRSSDALSFTTIYTAAALGLTNGSSYSYNDNQPFQPKMFYRLRITEAGGAVRHSSIVVLYDYEKSYWSVFPNPVSSRNFLQVNVQNTESATNATLVMLDASGRKVYVSRHQLVSGFQTISLPVQLPPGLYTLALTGFVKNTAQKIIVK